VSRFLEKIKEYLDFIEGPSYLLFMSEAGRCEYLIFMAVHLAIVQMLAQRLGIGYITCTAQQIFPQLVIGGIVGGIIGIIVCSAATSVALKKQFSDFKLVLMSGGEL